MPGLSKARPFLRWLGKKTQLLPHLLEYAPKHFAVYHEPFLGSGALFFALRPARAHLGDVNPRLIKTFTAVQRSLPELISRLQAMPVSAKLFEELRQVAVDDKSTEEIAAWMIYLNRLSFNGVYRVSKNGAFNAPFSNRASRSVANVRVLRACAIALQDAELHAEDFENVLERARPGDFVYCDPPYLSESPTGFNAYTAHAFSLEDHRRLSAVVAQLKGRGVHVLVSSSTSPEIGELYETGFTRRTVTTKRLVSGDLGGRRVVEEWLFF